MLSVSSTINNELVDISRRHKISHSIEPPDTMRQTEGQSTVRWMKLDNSLDGETLKHNISMVKPNNPIMLSRAKKRKLQMKSLVENIKFQNHRYVGPGTTKNTSNMNIQGVNMTPIQTNEGKKSIMTSGFFANAIRNSHKFK